MAHLTCLIEAFPVKKGSVRGWAIGPEIEIKVMLSREIGIGIHLASLWHMLNF